MGFHPCPPTPADSSTCNQVHIFPYLAAIHLNLLPLFICLKMFSPCSPVGRQSSPTTQAQPVRFSLSHANLATRVAAPDQIRHSAPASNRKQQGSWEGGKAHFCPGSCGGKIRSPGSSSISSMMMMPAGSRLET